MINSHKTIISVTFVCLFPYFSSVLQTPPQVVKAMQNLLMMNPYSAYSQKERFERTFIFVSIGRKSDSVST